MAKRHYKTLKGLLSQTLYGRINYEDLKCKRFYHRKLGWVDFTLSKDEEEKAYSDMASVIYADGKKYAHRLILYKGKLHGIFRGLMINKKGASYAAGQDYPSEIREIQKIFRS